jgi:hypothetical protein
MRPDADADADADAVAFLLQQPYKPRKYLGVSFFMPTCDRHILEAAHKRLGGEVLGCGASVPLTPLPGGMKLVNDHSFTLRLPGYGPDVPRTVIGQHYTLFAATALEELAERSSGNTSLFAALFALDMRSCDTDFDDVLEGCGNRAALVAVALDQYVVRDPILWDTVLPN